MPTGDIENAPTISLVEVYDGGDGKLWCQIGTLNWGASSINWGSSVSYDNGFDPAITGSDNRFVVFEVHQAAAGPGALWSRGGKSISDGNSFTGVTVSIMIVASDPQRRGRGVSVVLVGPQRGLKWTQFIRRMIVRLLPFGPAP